MTSPGDQKMSSVRDSGGDDFRHCTNDARRPAGGYPELRKRRLEEESPRRSAVEFQNRDKGWRPPETPSRRQKEERRHPRFVSNGPSSTTFYRRREQHRRSPLMANRRPRSPPSPGRTKQWHPQVSQLIVDRPRVTKYKTSYEYAAQVRRENSTFWLHGNHTSYGQYKDVEQGRYQERSIPFHQHHHQYAPRKTNRGSSPPPSYRRSGERYFRDVPGMANRRHSRPFLSRTKQQRFLDDHREVNRRYSTPSPPRRSKFDRRKSDDTSSEESFSP